LKIRPLKSDDFVATNRAVGPNRFMSLRLGILALFALCMAACGGGKKTGGGADASHPCGVYGTSCTTGDMCCSNTCDPQGACSANPTVCAMAGFSCSANTDCCSVSCINSVCSDKQCTADGASCSNDGECCGGSCTNGTCAPLNASCKTDGNPCTGNTDCCSSLCNANHVCGASSYCVQDGDACAHDDECCGDLCDIMPGHTVGVCNHPMPGSTLCSAGVDGTVCSGCGDCCSRLCETYAPTGVKICQPAEGCRVNGDICHTTSDCCGAAGTGLPGDGNVVCLKEHDTDPVGVCRNPQSCNPEGDVCHYQNYQTCGNSSARNDCCSAVGNSGVCQLDALGVPRCYGLGSGCQMQGSACAFSGDCCDGAPCVPDQNGVLHCGGGCVQMGSACTATADCCNGQTCIFTSGQEFGTCGSSGSGSSSCSQEGQSCAQNGDCCNGDCNIVDSSGMIVPCNGQSGCSCFTPIL
jgi:hypothetical protein